MRAFLLALIMAAFAPAVIAQTTTLVPADAYVSGPVLHDGHVAFLRKTPAGGAASGAVRLVRLDPATGRTAETPLAASGQDYDGLLTLAGRLYATTMGGEFERGQLLALDGPTFAPAPADPALATADSYTLSRTSGARAFVPLGGDSDPKTLAEVGADGRVTMLEAPSEGGRYNATPAGDAVYYVSETPAGNGYAYTLRRAAGGQSAPADVLPAGASVTNITAAGDVLYLAAGDGDVSRLYRLVPGSARAVPVPGFETPSGFSQALFRTLGDVLFFTAPDPNDGSADSGGRVRLYRQRDAAAPVQVPDLDLGSEATFFADGVREFDGTLYLPAVAPGEDPYGTLRTLYRVGPDGPPERVARVDGEDTYPQFDRERYVVAGGTVYFVLQDADGNLTLASAPLAGATRARSGRRR